MRTNKLMVLGVCAILLASSCSSDGEPDAVSTEPGDGGRGATSGVADDVALDVAGHGAAPGGRFLESFTGKPDAPTAWTSADWDLTVHSRDLATWDALEPMHAMHGPQCQGPPDTHETSSYSQAVFQCNDHMMTAIKAEGYGAIYLTPDRMVDFSEGAALISVDVSTLRLSNRDWWDIWITPFDDNLQLPLEDWLPDLNGFPRHGIRVTLTPENKFIAEVFDDGVRTGLAEAGAGPYDTFLEPDPARRDTFELRISSEHITFGMPHYGQTWVDSDLPDLGWSQGVVQFGHHSYNPEKAEVPPGGAEANTWHWDNVTIDPSMPFTMIHADANHVGGGASVATIGFDAPAPQNAHLRFAGIGTDIQISVDGGESWEPALVQWASKPGAEEHFRSYWTPVPEGVDQVLVRGTDWWAGPWRARDFSIWAPPA